MEVQVDVVHLDHSNLLVFHARSLLCFHSYHELPSSNVSTLNSNNDPQSFVSMRILCVYQRIDYASNEETTTFLSRENTNTLKRKGVCLLDWYEVFDVVY